MHARRLLSRLLFIVCALAGAVSDARAQAAIAESAYVTGGAFVDIKRFSGDPTEGILDGNVGGVAVAVGTHIGAHWDLQAGLDVTGYSRTDRPRTITLLKESFTLHSIAENQVLSVATLLRYRAATHGRWRLGYLAGLSFIRLRRRFHTEATADTPSGLAPKPSEMDDYSAAPTVGLDARFTLSEHLSVVPGIYASVFRFGEDSGLLVRPRIGLRWSF